tara:strand:- start:3301 stop:4599 length:1299 start_codon:yes stop_codon:yes gene_type:complete
MKLTEKSLYFGLFELAILIIIIYIVYFWKPNLNYIKTIFIRNKIGEEELNVDLYSKYSLPILISILVLIFFMIILYFFVKTRELLVYSKLIESDSSEYSIFKFLKKVVFIFCSIVIGIIVILILLKIIHLIPSIRLFNFLIGICFFLTTLTLLYYIVGPYIIKNLTDKNSFIYKVLFFIPAFLLFLLKNSGLDENDMGWTLLIIEIVLIVFYFILPIIWRWIFINDGIQLIKKPIYLNKKITLGDLYDKYYKDGNINEKLNYSLIHSNFDKIKKNYQHIYSISFWYYINPQPPNTGASYVKSDGANILSYGNKPVLKYYGKKNKLKLFTRSDNKNIKELVNVFTDDNILYQKWNNIVIIYDGGNCDVFLNSKLVGSEKNISPYMSYDLFEIGENNGIHGGICNLMYYNRKLAMNEILSNYKYLSIKYEPYFD